MAGKVVQTFTGLLQKIWEGIFGEGSFDGIQSFIDAVFGSTDGDGSGLFGVANEVVQTFANLFQGISDLFTGKTSLGDLISDLFGSYDDK